MGKQLQDGIQRRGMFVGPPKANGLMIRGVVIATYVSDSHTVSGSPNKDLPDYDLNPVGVYCDVLCYSSVPGMRTLALKRVLVRQEGGMHDGHLWKPRAATLDISGTPLDPDIGTSVSNMDGDHVLIGFMDDSLNLPVILGCVPHPHPDPEVSDKATVGHRRLLKTVDGDPNFLRHHGSFFGLDKDGNWLADTTKAHDGKLDSDGKEPVPPTGGSGTQKHLLPENSQFLVDFLNLNDPDAPVSKAFFKLIKTMLELKLDNGATLKSEGKDASAKLTVGDGAKSAIIAEAWQAFFDGAFKTWNIGHTHLTALGPTGVPVNAAAFPAYSAANATSTKLTFPDL